MYTYIHVHIRVCITQYSSTIYHTVLPLSHKYIGVLTEIPIITFSLWCTRLLASLVCRYGQKVTVIKKIVIYMPGKGGKLNYYYSPSCSGSSRVSH